MTPCDAPLYTMTTHARGIPRLHYAAVARLTVNSDARPPLPHATAAAFAPLMLLHSPAKATSSVMPAKAMAMAQASLRPTM